jgi:hypothetical protein
VHVERSNVNWCIFMDKIYKVVSAGENFGNLVCVSCKKNLLVSFLDLLDTICAIRHVFVEFCTTSRESSDGHTS